LAINKFAFKAKHNHLATNQKRGLQFAFFYRRPTEVPRTATSPKSVRPPTRVPLGRGRPFERLRKEVLRKHVERASEPWRLLQVERRRHV